MKVIDRRTTKDILIERDEVEYGIHISYDNNQVSYLSIWHEEHLIYSRCYYSDGGYSQMKRDKNYNTVIDEIEMVFDLII